jgi:hypothetical protein
VTAVLPAAHGDRSRLPRLMEKTHRHQCKANRPLPAGHREGRDAARRITTTQRLQEQVIPNWAPGERTAMRARAPTQSGTSVPPTPLLARASGGAAGTAGTPIGLARCSHGPCPSEPGLVPWHSRRTT